VVYEKDFGNKTLDEFMKMERFNPDKSWTPVWTRASDFAIDPHECSYKDAPGKTVFDKGKSLAVWKKQPYGSRKSVLRQVQFRLALYLQLAPGIGNLCKARLFWNLCDSYLSGRL
jgi:hypothetical protein